MFLPSFLFFFANVTVGSSAPPGSALTEHRSHDRFAASYARFAEPAVDREGVLEPALEPLGIDVVVDARSAHFDRALQNVDDRAVKPANRRLRQRLGGPARTDPGLPQRLARIDVSDARDALLVEQKRLDRRRPPPAYSQRPRCKVGGERFHAQVGVPASPGSTRRIRPKVGRRRSSAACRP